MKAAIYCRVSTEDQAEAKTIENQIDFAKRYCELHEIPIHDFYLDAGVSGTIALDQRPEGVRLLDDARAGRFTMVLVYRLDRMARSTRHLLTAHDQLKEVGIVFKSMTEPFDTSTGIGTFVMTLLASIAALERDTIVERMSLGRDRAARDGRWTGGKPPFGYRVDDDGYLVIEEQDAAVIRLIFSLYTKEHLSTLAIVDHLNAHNIPTIFQRRGIKEATSGKWDAAVLSRILRNPTYKGQHVYRKVTTTNKEPVVREVPAIVGQEVWDTAQATLRQNFVMADRNAKRDYLLKGKIKCGTCGRTYVGASYTKPYGEYVYYRCTSNAGMRGKGEPRCAGKSVAATPLEDLVWDDVKRFVENPGPVLELLEQRMKERIEHAAPIDVELREIDDALASKQAQRERVIVLYRKTLISDAEAEKELTQLQREVDVLELRRQSLLSRQLQDDALKTNLLSARVLLEQLRDKVNTAQERERRDLVEALVDRITVEMVDVDGTTQPQVTVTYCFQEPDDLVCSTDVRRSTRTATGSRTRSRTPTRQRWSGRCRTGIPMRAAR